MDIKTRGILLSRQRTTKALIRLCGCAGQSALFLFTYSINRFSHDGLIHYFRSFFYLGFTACQDYFTHSEPCQIKVGGKREIQEKNHLTIHNQSLARLT